MPRTIIRITDDTTVAEIDAELRRLHRGVDDDAIDALLGARLVAPSGMGK